MAGWRDRAAELERTQAPDASARFLIEEASRLLLVDRDAFDIAMYLKAKRQHHAAVEVLSVLVCHGPEAGRFHGMLELATCLQPLGRNEDAKAVLASARLRDEGSHWPVQQLAEIHLAEGRTDIALEVLASGYGTLRPDGRASIARKNAEIRAVAHVHDTFGQSGGALLAPAGPVAALERAGLMMMVKDEEDILAANLRHHYALGFRCFCILDNRSADSSAALVAAFRDTHDDALVLSVFDPVVGYYQSDKMAIFGDAFERYARLSGHPLDWMFFVDADEFLAFAGADPTKGRAALGAALDDPGAALLILHWINAASPELLEDLPPDADPFAVFTKRMSRLEPAVPKIAVRLGHGLAPMMGNHFVETYPLSLDSTRVLALADWYMMHCPLRSLRHVRRKVINGGRAFRDSQGLETHGGHWRSRYDAYLAHGDVVLEQILRQHIDSVG